MKFLVINGPNLNMLGIREPGIYGKNTLKELEEKMLEYCRSLNIDLEFYQSNHEGSIVDKIQDSYQKIDGIVINPAAYTHTSVAIPDAIKAVGIPSVEVHLSDVDSREDFRKISYVSPVCIATIKGKHFDGYIDAVDILRQHLNK